MPRSSDVSSCIATVVAVALLSGCASSRAPRAKLPQPPPLPAPVVEPSTPPAAPATPTLSVGPRTDTQLLERAYAALTQFAASELR